MLPIFLSFASLAGAPVEAPSPVEPGMQWIDVGQGDALLLVEPGGQAVLIDSGPSGGAEAVVDILDRRGITRLALWIHTHFDSDHVGGFARVLAGVDGRLGNEDDISVDVLWDRGWVEVPPTDAVALYGLLAGARRQDVSHGASVQVGELHVRSVPLSREGWAAENARGLALCIELGGVSLLSTGDLPAQLVEQAAQACSGVDVLWVSHHGAADGISARVLELTDPQLAVITAGYQNFHCHPSNLTLGLLAEREVWITHVAGLSPSEACEPSAQSLGAQHSIAGGDLWLPLR